MQKTMETGKSKKTKQAVKNARISTPRKRPPDQVGGQAPRAVHRAAITPQKQGLHSDTAILQQQIDYQFHNEKLLLQALTHRSFASEHNERLEFLGDAVLDLCVSDMVYQRYAKVPEGDLSRLRAHLVRQETLHEMATKLCLSSLLRLGIGEAKAGGAMRPSILADTLEALIGAIYLEAGYSEAYRVVTRLYSDQRFDALLLEQGKDAKTILQERLQAQRKALPAYHIVRIEGQAHQQIFEVECVIEHPPVRAKGLAASKRAAEQIAAQQVLRLWDEWSRKK